MKSLRKNKKGDLLGNMLVVFFTLIIFFALYPAMKVLIDLAVAVNAGSDPTLDFMLGSIGFVILLGIIKWIFNSVSSPQ